MTTQRCDGCRFFDEPTGECRRNAPSARVTSDLSENALAFWPEVKSDDWCGDHAPNARGFSAEHGFEMIAASPMPGSRGSLPPRPLAPAVSPSARPYPFHGTIVGSSDIQEGE